MRQTFTLTRHKDGTVTFKFGRYIEHFIVSDKTYVETYEYIKWTAITAGLQLNQETLEDLLRRVRNLHGQNTTG